MNPRKEYTPDPAGTEHQREPVVVAPEVQATVVIHPQDPPKKKLGRPKGSKNKNHSIGITSASPAYDDHLVSDTDASTFQAVPASEGNQPNRLKFDGAKKGTKAITFNYHPHTKQRLVWKAVKKGARIIMFLAGIRSGKSWAASYICLKLTYELNLMPNLAYVVTPTQNMARIPRRLFLQAAGDALVRYKRASADGPPHALLRPTEKLKTHNYLVEFHTGEHPDRLRGASVAWVWLDEAAYMKPEVYDIVQGRVMENPKSVILITTSPSTQSHWTTTEVYNRAARCGRCHQFYHDHDFKREGETLVPNDHEPENVTGDKDIAVITCATFDNTYLNKDSINDLKARYALKDPIIARRELFGEICGFEGLVYKSYDRRKHLSQFNRYTIPENAEIVAGIDFGVNDPFVCIFAARIGDTWHVIDEYYQKGGRSYADHVKDILKRPLAKRVKRWWYDPSDKQGGIELQRAGMKNVLMARRRASYGKNWIRYRIEIMQSLLMGVSAQDSGPLLRVSTECPNLTLEFECRKWKRYIATGDDGRERVYDQKGREVDKNAGDEPASGNDHCTDSIEYLIVSEIVTGRYKLHDKANPEQVMAKPLILDEQMANVRESWRGKTPLEPYLESQLNSHAKRLFKPGQKHQAYSIHPVWSQ